MSILNLLVKKLKQYSGRKVPPFKTPQWLYATRSIWLMAAAAAAAKSLQSCPSLCDPMDSSPPGSAVPGILQARTLEWVAISFSSAWKWKVKVKSLNCVPMDYSLPGSSVHGIFQARGLEWVAIAFSRLIAVCTFLVDVAYLFDKFLLIN